MDDRKFANLIGCIYEAPGNPAAWDAMLPALVGSFGAEHGHFLVYDSQYRVPVDFVTLREGGETYVKDYASFDTRVHRTLSGPDRMPVTQLDVLTVEELRNCPLHQEFYPKFGIEHSMLAKTHLGDGLSYMSVAIRVRQQGAYSSNDYRTMEQVHPHLERAMRLHLALREARADAATYEAGLDSLSTPLLLLNDAGGVCFANRAALRLLDDRNGLGLARGRLVAVTSTGNARLQAVLARAIGRLGPAEGGGVLLERPAGRPLVVRVLPARQEFRHLAARAAAIVLVHDPAAPPEIGLDVLTALGLTRAEAMLAQAIASGQSLATFARGGGVSLHTARTQLRDIFEKTDTHRQAELVALLRSLSRP